jgi:hypothetical protein
MSILRLQNRRTIRGTTRRLGRAAFAGEADGILVNL